MNRGTVRLLVLALAACIAALLAWLLPVREEVAALLEYVHGLGFWGLGLIAALYTPASLFLVPGSLLTLGAGFLYPLGPAFLAVSFGSTLAAAIVFLTGRTLARSGVESRLSHMPRFRALDRAVGEQGFLIVLLTRLSPLIPFTLLNYAFSLTRVRFRDYLLASWLGMIPGTLLYVYLGSLIGNVADLVAGKATESEQGQGPRQALFYLGLAATLAATMVIGRIAQKTLRRALDAAEETPHE